MKKKLLFISLFLLAIACSKPSECVESLGDLTTKNIEVQPFTKLFVNPGIEVIIKQATTYKVTISTGGNLIDNIEVTQDGSTLTLTDKTTCNWVREYGQTKVYISAPNIENIYSKTERPISSDGVLTFPILRFFALDKEFDSAKGAGTGDFYININNGQVVVESNNVARFFISGATNEALFNFYGGDSRLDAQNLLAQNIKIFHRGSNDMVVRPIQKIEGKLLSTGNLIVKNNPPINTLQQLYTGQIIYN